MQDGLVIVIVMVVGYCLFTKSEGFEIQEGIVRSAQNVTKKMSKEARAAARTRKEGFRSGREAAKLAKAATGGRGREGYSAATLMSGVYGATPDASGEYVVPGGPKDCGSIDDDAVGNQDAANYMEYVNQGHFAYGLDVIRNHSKWVDEVAPWSQTAAVAIDDLAVEEMLPSKMMGIAAWMRPGPQIAADALQQMEVTEAGLDALAESSGGVFNTGETDKDGDGDTDI
jgi:hypothetical protein